MLTEGKKLKNKTAVVMIRKSALFAVKGGVDRERKKRQDKQWTKRFKFIPGSHTVL